jgi:DNA polymerase
MGLSPQRDLQLRACASCALYRTRHRVVLGEGPLPARWIALGEAPGAKENETGRPFVHVAGDWLDRMFVSLGIQRSEVFLVNSARCRPPNNRTPLPDEVDACLHRWFVDELDAAVPEVLFLLGSTPALAILGARIRDVRGQLWTAPGVTPVIYPLFHPAVHAYDESEAPDHPRALTRADLARWRAWREQVERGEATWTQIATPREGAPGLRSRSAEE